MVDDGALRRLIDAIAAGDDAVVHELLNGAPALATAVLQQGATRAASSDNFLTAIAHHVYAGDTALHVAAAAHRVDVTLLLLGLGAAVAARNRRGATPLHYATDGNPAAPGWDEDRQATTIATLIASGADPDAVDRGGVAPLHRAVRNRCAAAVAALIDGGADPRRRNGNGSTPFMLAKMTTGRGSSGGVAAKSQQAEIIDLFARYGISA